MAEIVENIAIPMQKLEEKDVDLLSIDLEGATYDTFDWEKYFSDSKFGGFNGNIPNATELMRSFVKGMMYMKNEKQKTDEDLPKIVFSPNEPLEEKNIHYARGMDKKNKTVVITKSYLEKMSTFIPGQNIKFELPDKTIIMEGILSQIFELIGVEETCHAIFDDIDDPEKLSLEEIEQERLDAEIAAVKIKEKYANANRFPRSTVAYLQKELKDLKELSKKGKKNKDEVKIADR